MAKRMKALTSIVEARAVDDTLYHYTPTEGASGILSSDTFKLTQSMGRGRDEEIQSGRRPYYLSTARSSMGGYGRMKDEGVMLNLDGNKLSQHYKISPVAFYDQEEREEMPTTDEYEDRVLSYVSTIPNASSYIKSIHIVNVAEYGDFDMSGSDYRKYLRNIVIAAKRRNIEIYWYATAGDFIRQINPIQVDTSKLSTKTLPSWEQYRKQETTSRPLLSLVELIKKPTTQPLSAAAQELVNLNVTEVMAEIEADISFGEQQGRDQKSISAFMRRNRLNSIEELVHMVQSKWGKE